MKLTQQKLIIANRILLAAIPSEVKLPVKVKVAALRNVQKIKPFQETYDKLVSDLAKKVLEERGFEKGRTYTAEEERVFNLAVGNAVMEDDTIQAWLKEEVSVELVTVKFDDLVPEFDKETKLEYIQSLQELEIID